MKQMTLFEIPKREIWTIKEIKSFIRKNPKNAWKAALELFQYQTLEEINLNTSNSINGIGFNKPDAEFFTPIIKRGLENGWISIQESKLLIPKILKYSKQLTRIANLKLKNSKKT